MILKEGICHREYEGALTAWRGPHLLQTYSLTQTRRLKAGPNDLKQQDRLD